MTTRQLTAALFCAAGIGLFAFAAATATHGAAPDSAFPRTDKELVIDGHVVHDAGQIRSHQSNWGLIGSQPGTSVPYAESPSAMWPGLSGNEYLWAAGLWVGARDAQGVPHVTTATFATEFRPTPAPADTIYRTARGAPGGNRFPWPGADDDGDGLEDEDPLDGRDDDGDGLVDEDFAAIGEQHFISRYNDTEPELTVIFPDHAPLGLAVVQQSFVWGDPLGEDFIGYDFAITNTGNETLHDVYVGMFSDADIGPRGVPGIAADDRAGYYASLVRGPDGDWIPVSVAYMRDASAVNPLPGWIGWVACNTAFDDAPPSPSAVRSFQHFHGNESYANGGDPTNDAERYDAMSREEIDPDVPPTAPADYRVLLSSGPFVDLAPGATLHYRVALVLGDGFSDMMTNAAFAVQTAWGRSYDRDGDPANGEEFHVPWLRPDETPVTAATGRLAVRAVHDGAELLISVPGPLAADIEVQRQADPGVPARTWSASALVPTGQTGDRLEFVLRDDDPVGWPRRYELAAVIDGARLALDRTRADGSVPARVGLVAGPNPFNPRVRVHLALPRDGHVLLQAFDVRGRRVATLLQGQVAAGERTVTWEGRDDAGRDLPSGVYHLRLQAADGAAATRVTLVR